MENKNFKDIKLSITISKEKSKDLYDYVRWHNKPGYLEHLINLEKTLYGTDDLMIGHQPKKIDKNIEKMSQKDLIKAEDDAIDYIAKCIRCITELIPEEYKLSGYDENGVFYVPDDDFIFNMNLEAEKLLKIRKVLKEGGKA